MRHLSACRFTYMIAALLVAGCALFAWIRSHDIWIAPRAAWPRPETVAPPAPPAPGEAPLAVPETAAAADRMKRGAETYRRSCSMCHGELPHLGELARVRGSREYLVDLLLYGLEGRIPIRGANRDVYHPPFDSESDDDLAATLDHLFANWGNDAARPADWSRFESAEVARARQHTWTPDEMRARRLALEPE